jgi:hypothetical protein
LLNNLKNKKEFLSSFLFFIKVYNGLIMTILYAIFLFIILVAIIIGFYIYHFKAAKKMLEKVEAFYLKFFSEAKMSFCCPEVNKIYFNKTFKILSFSILFSALIFGSAALFLIIELGINHEMSLVTLTYFILLVILSIISFPLAKYF